MKKIYTKKYENSGSVLVITILVTAVLLAIGITLFSILEKDILRQSYGRRSQIAIRIANSALECTLFNDFRRSAFQTLLTRKHDEVNCGDLYQVRKGTNWSAYSLSADEKEFKGAPAGTGTYRFVVIQSTVSGVDDLLKNVSNVPCAHITVKKVCTNGVTVGTNVCSGGLIESSIEVKGYSSCSPGEAEAGRELVRRFKVYY